MTSEAIATTWRRHRRIVQPAFSSKNVATFAADMDAAARRAIRRWDGSQVVDAASEMSAIALDVAGRALFGADLPAQDPSLDRALAAGQRLALLAALPYLVHRNPAVWPNPSCFDPARFLPGAAERHRYAWIPFGGGKRGCTGAGFARQEAVLVLARLCRHYRLDLASPGLPRPRGLVTLRPAGPVPMRLTRRG